MSKRIEAGTVIAAAGALLLLVSLFLDWFEPGISAWTTFEIVDLLLAVIAIAVLATALGRLVPESKVDPAYTGRWLPAASGVALVLVIATLINHPPAAIDLGVEVGIWLALGGAVLMALGTLADRAHVSFSFSVSRPEAPNADAERDPAATPPPGSGPARATESSKTSGPEADETRILPDR